MISLRKYLDAAGRRRTEQDQAGAPHTEDSLYRFSSALLETIHDQVLVGGPSVSFRTQLTQLRESLRPDGPDAEESAGESTARRILGEHRTFVQQAAAQQAMEIQQIFAI